MVAEIAKLDPAAGYLARVRLLTETKAAGDLDALYAQAAAASTTVHTAYESRSALMNRHIAANPPRLDQAERQARELIKIAPSRLGGYTGLATSTPPTTSSRSSMRRSRMARNMCPTT